MPPAHSCGVHLLIPRGILRAASSPRYKAIPGAPSLSIEAFYPRDFKWIGRVLAIIAKACQMRRADGIIATLLPDIESGPITEMT